MARRFTTPVVLPGDPSAANEAANKGYVDTGLGGKSDSGHNHNGTYATSGHTHSPDLVPFAVQTLASSATLTMNASLGKHFRCTALATNTTVADPTNKTDGQPLILEVAAQTSTRTISLNAAIVNCSGVTFPLSLAANKRWFGGFLISGTTAYLLSSAVQP